MADTVNNEKKALSALCGSLNEKKIAAELNEENTALSIYLGQMPGGEEIFLDAAFMPQGEGMDGISFFVLQGRIMDLGGLSMDKLFNVFVSMNVLDSTLEGGHYSIEMREGEDDSLTAGDLIYRYTLPAVPELDSASFSALLEDAVRLAFFDIKETLPDLISLIKGEISEEEFMKSVLG